MTYKCITCFRIYLDEPRRATNPIMTTCIWPGLEQYNYQVPMNCIIAAGSLVVKVVSRCVTETFGNSTLTHILATSLNSVLAICLVTLFYTARCSLTTWNSQSANHPKCHNK
jgi:hypothetical protein